MTDEPPPLREPDLPRTARVRPKALRTGWTTGTCASAAAKAAAMLLVTGEAPAVVEVGLPAGRRVEFTPLRCEWVTTEATETYEVTEAVVVKDAGDDPDVTHGAHITATVSWQQTRPHESDERIVLAGGSGVGVVTKPGLGLPVGGPAINPTPQRMIRGAVGEALAAAHDERGVTVVISVPDGERMARKTTNARLGIIGGISILGTTGIVRPFSTESWRASVVQAVAVLAAQGEQTVVLCTGGRTEAAAMRMLPDLGEICFVEVGDFTGAALRRAAEEGVSHVVFVGMAGKLTKLAAGVLMTHYTKSRVDLGLLGQITRSVTGDDRLAQAVDDANTGRHAYELWEAAGVLAVCGGELCRRVQEVLVRFGDAALTGRTPLTAEVAMVDFSGSRVVAATTAEWLS